ncbi:MAG TPA: potassium transporter TrkA [Lachnospiraceae bacterium]|nr:potassium transporter TrkA [Lachnospiraceae bacterium]
MKRLTSKQEYENYTIIVGCGRLGATLANTLSDRDENVLIIDKNKDSFRKLSPSFGGLSIIGDATDIDVMLEAQIGNASAVIAVTNNDNANIMVAQIAREMFHIKRVIARLYDPEREYVYHEFDIDTICPAILSAKGIDKILSQNVLQKNVVKEEEQ